jgi:hypothetical protein
MTMPGQPVLDPVASAAARDEGMQRAWSAADPVWKAWAGYFIWYVACTSVTFTADDVWALGPVLVAMAREGLIEKTHEVHSSAQVSRNSGLVSVWRRKA